MKIPVFQADAFADKLFQGNPAAVCPLNEWLSDGILQNIASENNLSETAFFIKDKEGFHIRWFTPETEVSLCGHATLATAAVIFRKLNFKGEEIVFHSASGNLKVKQEGALFTLDFPSEKAVAAEPHAEIQKALNVDPKQWLKGKEDYLLVCENEGEISSINPDFHLLKKHSKRGIIVTAPGTQTDIVSRFFAPAVGINEDPVTGSAHTLLIPYWSERLNKKKITSFQLSKRGGRLQCEDRDERVLISGKVSFYMQGIITVF